MKKNKLLAVSFSGGRTSAFMSVFLMHSSKYKDYDKIFIFANTSKEREETYDFIKKVSEVFRLNLVCLEAEVNPIKGKGTTFKVVPFNLLKRDGSIFENVIKKYGLPTVFSPHCTREMKSKVIDKYVKSLGYKEVIRAIGVRYDERHRAKENMRKKGFFYPLIDDIRVDARFIRDWWSRQDFDLKLKEHQGNCDLCFKKSLKKRLTLAVEDPRVVNWWRDMEKIYGTDRVPRFDLRQDMPVKKIKNLSKDFQEIYIDEYQYHDQPNLFDNYDMDTSFDCICSSNV